MTDDVINNKDLKILVGMPAPGSWGGPIYCEPPFVDSLRKAGADADEEVYVYGESGRKVSIIARIRRVLAAAFRLRRRAAQKRYDIIHLNTSFDEKCVLRDLTTMFLLGRNVPIYLKMHGSIAAFLKSKSSIWRRLQRMVFDRAAMIGVLSKEEGQMFIDAGCPAAKLHFCKYVVETKEFVPDTKFRERHGIRESAYLMLFSGRFIPAKGLITVVRSMAELKNRGRQIFLFCLGDGPDRESAESLVHDLELKDSILFTGYIAEDETAEFHANCDIFVLPTEHDEGFPLVIVKSLAAGMAVITTSIRGAADHLGEEINCLFVPPNNPSAIADAVERIIDDPKLRATMRKENRALASTFSGANVANEYLEVYLSMIGQGR